MRVPATWDEAIMKVAEGWASRSKDPNTQVGCQIVDRVTHRPLSAGFNGMPPGMLETPERWSREEKVSRVLHAEQNAICSSERSLVGSLLYTTLHPCLDCAKAILSARIAEVCYRDFRDFPEAASLLTEAGVVVRQLEKKNV